MRIGLTPLILAILVAATRLTGASLAADALAYVYLTVVTVTMLRGQSLTAAERA